MPQHYIDYVPSVTLAEGVSKMENRTFESFVKETGLGGGATEEQKAVILNNDKVLYVNAGPGSGKTQTIINKIAYHLYTNPETLPVLYITLTKKAANEGRERLVQALGETAAKKVEACTYYSWAFNRMRTVQGGVGQVRVATGYATKKYLNALAVERAKACGDIPHTVNFPTKDGYRSADNLKQWAQKYARPYVNTLLKHLNTVHEQENCFEFDDFIRMAASYYSRQAKKEYSCVFVDEVQDMSATDSSLLECFHSMSEKLVLVGDTDQSIYRFRGADIQSVLKKVASSWGDISTASLTKNFRCRKEIVGASDVVANAQASRQGMHVEHCSAVDGSGEVNLVRIKAANYEDFCDSQSKYVARLCKELPGSTAILANKMKMSKNLVIRSSIEQELKNNNITYGVATGKLQTELLSLASCLWKSVVTNDRLSLEVCLSTINGVGVIKSKKLAAAVLGGSRLGISLPTALAFLEAWDALRDAYDNAGEEYSNFVKNFSATFLNLIATSTLRLDSDCLQYAQCLLPDIQKCAQQAVSGNGDAWTENILDETTVCSGDKPEVILSTIHSAKGLEFDNVIVVNAFAEVKSAGWLCGYCVFGNDADEEMRKLYVAITRAKQSVTVITAAPDDAIGLPVLQNICWDSTESVNDEEDVG